MCLCSPVVQISRLSSGGYVCMWIWDGRRCSFKKRIVIINVIIISAVGSKHAQIRKSLSANCPDSQTLECGRVIAACQVHPLHWCAKTKGTFLLPHFAIAPAAETTMVSAGFRDRQKGAVRKLGPTNPVLYGANYSCPLVGRSSIIDWLNCLLIFHNVQHHWNNMESIHLVSLLLVCYVVVTYSWLCRCLGCILPVYDVSAGWNLSPYD